MTNLVLKSLNRLHQDESGQGLVEYLLILALVAFAATAGMGSLATGLNSAFIQIGKILGSLVLGLLAFIPTVALAYFGFHAILPALDPLRFAISLGVLSFSFFIIAVALTPVFAMWRWAFTVLNGLELGVYGLCGFMFPVTQLPHWLQPISYALSPTWATRALYASASSSPTGDITSWWLTALGLSAVYLVVGVVLYRFVEVRARVSGELALA